MTPTPTAPGINPNLLTSLMQAQGTPSLQLTQIDKYDPPAEFTDSAGSRWLLVKDSRSGAGEVPDPAGVNVTDYWMHEFPGSGGKIFLYVVEGLRPPKTQREAPPRQRREDLPLRRGGTAPPENAKGGPLPRPLLMV